MGKSEEERLEEWGTQANPAPTPSPTPPPPPLGLCSGSVPAPGRRQGAPFPPQGTGALGRPLPLAQRRRPAGLPGASAPFLPLASGAHQPLPYKDMGHGTWHQDTEVLPGALPALSASLVPSSDLST